MIKNDNQKYAFSFLRRLGARGQSLLETALVLPILLLISFSTLEGGRIMIMFAEVSSASREAARFAAASGPTISEDPRYLDCDAIVNAAGTKTVLTELPPAQVQIAYDRPVAETRSMEIFGYCGGITDPDDFILGDRVVVTVTATVRPMLKILPIPELNPTSVTARTILKNHDAGPPERLVSLGINLDGHIDHLDDKG